MKRILTFLVSGCLIVCLAGQTPAVEKKQKEKPAKTAPAKQPTAPKLKPSDNMPRDSNPSQAPKTEKKYDTFVDKNNNGIDDRKENPKKKQ